MKSKSIQTNFLSGELSPLIKGNIELEQYYRGAEKLENVVIVPQGGVKRRAGLAHLTKARNRLSRNLTSPTMPNGGTPLSISDNSDNTTTTTTGPIGTTDYVIAQYDLGSATQINFVDVRNISLSAGTTDRVRVEYSADGSSWASIVGSTISVYEYAKSKRIDVDHFGIGPYRYWRLVRLSGAEDLGAAVFTLAGFELWSETASISNAKLVNIASELGQGYFGSVTEGNIYISRIDNLGIIKGQNLKLPYSNNDVSTVRVASIENVTLLFQENHPVIRIVNYGDPSINSGANTNPFDGEAYFNLDYAPISNVPQFDFNDSLSPTPVAEIQVVTFTSFAAGTKYQIDVEGVLSKQIVYAGDSGIDEQQATEFNLQKNLQEMPVFGDHGVSVNRTGPHQYTITVDGESAKSFRLFSGFPTDGGGALAFTRSQAGSPRKESVWNGNRGYPRMGAFHQGRLWLGGIRDKKQAIFASKSGSFLDFDTGEGDDDDAIFVTLSSKHRTDITDIYSGRNLLVFTSGGEYADLGETITPGTINLISQSSNGSKLVPVEEADGAVIFADRNGKTLREFLYTFNEDAYTPTDITVLSSHLINNPVSMSFLTGTSSDDANWLFIVNSDGTVSILNKLRSQDINGFTKMETSGTVKETIVSDESVYFIVQREVNGVFYKAIESWDFNHRMDASITRQLPVLTSTVAVNGMDHLEGLEVSLRHDNIVLPSRVVSGGSVELTTEERDRYATGDGVLEAGLNFIPAIQPMPLNTNGGSGQNFMKIKKIVRMNIRVYDTLGIYIENNPIAFRNFGANAFGPQEGFTGIIDDYHPAEGWNRDIMPIITCPDPTPMHIQAIEFEVESS